MFSDNTTRDLAKTALKIMTKDIQEEETPTQELAESTQIDEVQQLAEDQISEMTTNIMEEINALGDEDKVQLGESLIEAHRNSLTED